MKGIDRPEAFPLLVGLASKGSPGGRIFDHRSVPLCRPNDVGGDTHQREKSHLFTLGGSEGTCGISTCSSDGSAEAAEGQTRCEENQHRYDVTWSLQAER